MGSQPPVGGSGNFMVDVVDRRLHDNEVLEQQQRQKEAKQQKAKQLKIKKEQ